MKMKKFNSLPSPGTVFIHTSNPWRPLIVVKEDSNFPGQLIRLDVDATIVPWGFLEEWNDEIRRGTIRIVYIPSVIVSPSE